MRIIMALIGFFLMFNAQAWNAMGHQLVAQIAYDNLTSEAKIMCKNYMESYESNPSEDNFVSAASWMDTLRANDIHWYDSLHYIDLQFTKDDTPLPSKKDKHHVVWGINQAMAVLSSNKTSLSDKGLSLRILTHLTGDIHQPLHTATLVSQRHPKGDSGGNLFFLRKNPIGKNLHQYWDNGAGILLGANESFQIKNKARQLESQWPCQKWTKNKNPRSWANESHQLATKYVYNLPKSRLPSKSYQLMAQNISQKQLIAAGCRLSMLLNNLAKRDA